MKRATGKNVSAVLRRFADYIDSLPASQRTVFARDVNIMLDGIGDADGFGTEGQCDPRADRRDEDHP